MKPIAIFFSLYILFSCGNVLALEDAELQVVEPAATIPYKDSHIGPKASYSRVFFAFFILICVVGGVIFILSRTSIHKKLAAFQGQRIRVIESKRIFPKVNLYLISVDEKEYLLTQSNEGVFVVEHGKEQRLENENTNE